MGATRSLRLVLGEARRALQMSQAQFGQTVGSSHRSAVRWDAGQSVPAPEHLIRLAALLHARHRDLAAEVAAFAGQTLVSLNLEAPPSPPESAVPPPPPPRAKPEDLVDILVLAGVVESGASVVDVRRWIHTVCKRACDVGLTIEEVEMSLRPKPPVAPKAEASG